MIKSKLYTVLFIILILIALVIIGITSTTKETTMHVKQAELTKKEQSIFDLMKLKGSSPIYDFAVDESAKTIQIRTYKLDNGKWVICNSYGPGDLKDYNGRIAFRFDKIAHGISTMVQVGNNTSAATVSSGPPLKDYTGMGVATCFLSTEETIKYEKEIPLAIQTAQDLTTGSHDSGNVQQFFQPEMLSDASYKHVYAVTVMFSQGLSA